MATPREHSEHSSTADSVHSSASNRAMDSGDRNVGSGDTSTPEAGAPDYVAEIVHRSSSGEPLTQAEFDACAASRIISCGGSRARALWMPPSW